MDVNRLASDMAKLNAASPATPAVTVVAAGKPASILAHWCLENHLDPQFKFQVQTRKKIVRCELIVPGTKYKGIGYSKTEKSAQKEATKDFLLFLVRQNSLNVALPAISKKEKKTKDSEINSSSITKNKEKKTEDSKINSSSKTKNVTNMDANPVIHGGWTIDNAKDRLMQFIKSHNKNSYTATCKFTGTSYIVDISIFIVKLDKTISVCETGQSKKSATQKCELSLVSQLCGLGQIENCSSVNKKTKIPKIITNLSDVSIKGELVNDIYSLLGDLDIKPVINKNTGIIHEGVTLPSNKISGIFNHSNIFNCPRVVLWSPPKSNWHPWLGVSTNKNVSLSTLSIQMAIKRSEIKIHSITLRKRIKDRADLPISNKKDEILHIVKNNPVVIVHGGTGCGKTTQVCQFILDEFIHTKKGAHCNIICTQPRKVSAISIAKRVAFERAEALGISVGYTVRFDSIRPQSFGSILFCTTEILIRQLKKGLIGISHVIVDEIHERNAESEFLLIILKDVVQKYPDLRVILMSANANLKVFSKYFYNCPIVDVQGRCYPVKEYFLEDIVQMLNFKPVEIKKTKKNVNKEIEVNCNLLVSHDYPSDVRNRVAMIDENSQHLNMIESLLIYIEKTLKTDGAVLIFLPGWAWIIELKDHLEKKEFLAERCQFLPLHSNLSHAEQQKVFKHPPRGIRKVILSTNIAETSVTIDDVVFVIDYGKMKTIEFANNITKLNTVWASKVNVEQRRGRAGRVQAGICFNLYSKERFNRLDENVSPELMNCSLSKYALTIKWLQLGDIRTFFNKAIDPPPREAVHNVITMLTEMKCLNENGELTALGNILAQLPVEPPLGRMMVLGNILKLGNSLSAIAAGSSTNYDIFISNYDQITVKHNFSGNRCSDQLAFLNAFKQWEISNDICNSVDNDFFDEYGILTSVLKTTNKIKDQIINKFLHFGFPECCFEEQDFDFGKTGIVDEPELDIFPGLLTMAFYPNIYYYKKNRKVEVKSKNFAVVSRDSVNSPTNKLKDGFQSPFFVFEQQLNVMCVHSTMVTPIHILLFGNCKVQHIENLVVLDNWIYLNMDVKSAAALVGLRPAIEDLITRTTQDPKLISKPNRTDAKLIKILRELCNYNAGRHNLSPITFYVATKDDVSKTEHKKKTAATDRRKKSVK